MTSINTGLLLRIRRPIWRFPLKACSMAENSNITFSFVSCFSSVSGWEAVIMSFWGRISPLKCNTILVAFSVLGPERQFSLFKEIFLNVSLIPSGFRFQLQAVSSLRGAAAGLVPRHAPSCGPSTSGSQSNLSCTEFLSRPDSITALFPPEKRPEIKFTWNSQNPRHG
jgi:hypothetical protein